MMKFYGYVLAAVLLLQVGPEAFAQTSHGGGHGKMDAGHKTAGVKVTKPWARASAKMARAGAAYMTLENTAEMPDKLLSASTPVAAKAELHTHLKDGAVMRMREVQSIEVGPKATVRLQPGGLHVMLMNLKNPLEKGTNFPLTLVFEKAGAVTVDVTVEAAGAMGTGGEQGHGHGGMKH